MTAFISLLLSIVLLTGCKEEAAEPTAVASPAITAATASATPAPSATPADPAAGCFPTPSELGNPGPLRRQDVDGATVFVAQGVTDEDRQRVLDGLATARAYLAREFGPVQRHVCIELRAEDLHTGSAITIQNRIIVFTQRGGWSRPYPWLLSRATAHEYVHVWTAEVANDFAPATSSAYGPGWLVEGVAEFLSMRMVLEAGLAPREETEMFSNTLLRLSNATLEELEPLPLPNPEDYATAELAVSRLMTSRPLSALQTFYTLLGRRTAWPAAFATAFGVAPHEFYRQFAATP
ncbi:MAG: hypothetical protein AB7P33_16640 [Dehalococcoidia bacterium]